MVKICEVVDGCEDCPKYGDDCDGDKMTEHTDLISREDAIKAIDKQWLHDVNVPICGEIRTAIVQIISALPSVELPKGELISRADALGELNGACSNWKDDAKVAEIINALPSADADGANLINRHDAVTVIREECWKCNNMINDDLFMRIMSLPTSRQTDCTEFIEWLVEVVMDDEDWELNAVAYGEVICRKLEKLGVLETTEEPSYYIRPSAEAVQGEWIHDGQNFKGGLDWCHCSVCGQKTSTNGLSMYNFCPNCGAIMVREDGEE